MTRRRGFGNLRKLPSGRWQARYELPGGSAVVAPATFRTKAEANQWLSTVEADRARGLWIDPRAGRVPLDEYARRWLESKVGVSPRTREIYELQLRLHVLPPVRPDVPALGSVPLADITPELVRAWYGGLAATRGPSVAAKAYSRLRQILGQAVDDDRIAKNPCRINHGAVERHPEQRFASLIELYQLAGAVPDRYRALVLTAGLGGLRQGELFALRRRDVDLLHASISVRRKRLRLASGLVIEDHPKSEAGRRRVAIPSPLVMELDRHLLAYVAAAADAYVFTSAANQPLEASNFRSRIWQPATRAVGVPGLRFHDLRHTAGTLAARTGATTKELMARLGHSSPSAAMVYQHASEDRDRLIAERLAAMAAEAGLAPVVPIETARAVTSGRASGTP
jgi:integrase